MLNLRSLCEKIDMPGEVIDMVAAIEKNLDLNSVHSSMDKLNERLTWMEGVEELRLAFSEDNNGLKMLTCMLCSSILTYDRYQKMGIDDKIYFDTFACFSRFVKEHKESYGTYGFDRDWWTPRQIAMQEFRIDELEYEMVCEEGRNMISVHIPSNADMDKVKCLSSYHKAKDFFAMYYPDYQYEQFFCDSWLLSPNLKDVLTSGSKILSFQSAYEIIKFDKDATEFMEWIFKNPDLPLEELPEHTSLQRNLKEYLKNGGKIGGAVGYLKLENLE